jgi:hypothetical protein
MVRIQRRCWQALPYVLAFVYAAGTTCSAQKFLPDDPLTRTPEVAPLGATNVQNINALYDFAHNSFHYKNRVATVTPAPLP